MQPFPPSGEPKAPEGATPPPDPDRSGSFGPVVILAAVVTFAVVLVAAIVVVTQISGRPATGDVTADRPAFVTKPPSSATPTTGSTDEPSTTEPTSSSAPSTAPPTTSPEQALAQQLGEDATAAQLRIPPRPAAKGQFQFLHEFGGQPVSFDACRPIHYVVRVGAGPANGLNLVTEAIRRLSSATGLRFVYDGPTTTVPRWEEPSQSRSVTDLASEFTPVFIGWATPSETDIWAHAGKDVLGVGGPESLSFDDGAGELYVTGHAVLLPNANVANAFGPGVTEGNLLLHELGHVVGLDHVAEGGETMDPDLTEDDPDGYGPGDLQGLYALGSSRGCASNWLPAMSKAGG